MQQTMLRMRDGEIYEHMMRQRELNLLIAKEECKPFLIARCARMTAQITMYVEKQFSFLGAWESCALIVRPI